jgi:hypothetical protein
MGGILVVVAVELILLVVGTGYLMNVARGQLDALKRIEGLLRSRMEGED